MERKWNSEEIFKFLDHVQKHPVLWDVCHADYKNRSQKEDAYTDLLQDLLNDGFSENITTSYLKDKLKNIRDTYAVEVKKILAWPVTEGKEYKPKLLWFDRADAFLRPSFTRKKCISRITLRRKPSRRSAIRNSIDENEFTESSFQENRDSSNKTRTKNIEQVIMPTMEQPSEDLDEHDYFGKIVAINLRRLSQEDAWKAEDEITQILRKYKRKKRQIYSDFIEVSPEHLLSDPFTVNNLSSPCSGPNLESASEVSSMCLENENPPTPKRPCIQIIKVKSDSDPEKMNQQVHQQVYLVS